jgi:hypothetical protein
MSNDVTVRNGGGLLATNDGDFLSNLSQYAQETSNKAYLRMSGNDGSYTYGSDKTEAPDKTQAVVNHMSFTDGWVIWSGGEVAETISANVVQGEKKPPKAQLPDHGPYGEDDGPREQMTVDVKLLLDVPVDCVLQASNKSSINSMKRLIADFLKVYKSHQGEYAIIELTSVTFDATDPNNPKRKFKKYAPSWKIVGWMTEDELAGLSEGNPEDYESEEAEDQAEDAEIEAEAEEAPQSRPAPARSAAARPAAAAPKAAPAGQPAGRRRGSF